jgi:hypothetical protein
VNFRPELAAAVMAGKKTVTRRLVSENPRSPWWRGGCKKKVGRDYAVCPGRGKHAIGRVVITEVTLEHLGDVGPGEARREGFSDVRAFQQEFATINGCFEPDTLVWRIAFRVLPVERNGGSAT